MGTLYLVRHGQASLGAQDYDQLSPLGQRQSERLGAHFHQQQRRFDAVLTGTLRRHAQTYAGICQGMGVAPEDPGAPPLTPWPGLNEYDSHALMACLPSAATRPRPDTPDGFRAYFRLLRDALGLWMKGDIHPEGMPSWADFQHGVVSALDHIRTHHTGDVLLVSSGGPIATAISHVLDAPQQSTIDLNMRLRNSALTEFAFTRSRHSLLTYNTLPHLSQRHEAGWITYA